MRTDKFEQIFNSSKPLIGMIHVPALPGTPRHTLPMKDITQRAVAEAKILQEGGVQAIMLENMHDVPYLNRQVGPEIVASMTAVCSQVRATVDLPLGIQILAGANREALAVAQACDLQFIRAEGYIFGHLADEGMMESDAGSLLRFRKLLGVDHIGIFTDIKKKHSSHALTMDISLEETLKAAEFFLSDGAIITGNHTGDPVDIDALATCYAQAGIPVLVGSGITPEGLINQWDSADGFIVGTYIKSDGQWQSGPDPDRIRKLVETRAALIL